MDRLVRVKTLLQTRRPRVLGALRDFDRLRRGCVSVDQFFRAFEAMGITFTADERYALEERYATATSPREIPYEAALAELEAPDLDPALAAPGTRTGTTSVYSMLVVPNVELSGLSPEEEARCKEVLDQLRTWVRHRPIIGRLFYEDFDAQHSGLITANQFMRGTSNMWEALIRRFPSKETLDLLAKAFRAKRVVEFLSSATEEPPEVRAELSDSRKIVDNMCDYRVFVAAIGADKGDDVLSDVKKQAPPDVTFGRFFDSDKRPSIPEHTGLERIIALHQRSRPDFKTFLQARDTRRQETLPLRDFCAAISSAIPDPGRAGVDYDDIMEVGKLFLRPDPLNTSDYEGLPVDYRAFLRALQEATLTASSNSTMRDAVFKYIQDSKENARVENTANLPPPTQREFQFNTLPIDFAIIRKLQDYLNAHPAPLLQCFAAFDKRHTGRITTQQFKQALSGIVGIVTAARTPSTLLKDAKIRTAPFIRANNGLTDEELEKLACMFATETVSGRGTVQQPPVAPDVLARSGLFVNYYDFVEFISSRYDGILPDTVKPRHPHDTADYLIPHPSEVLHRIVNFLHLRNLKLADFLTLSEFGNATHARSVVGCIGLRNVQRQLSYSLEINLTDPELLALGYMFSNPVDPNKQLSHNLPLSGIVHDTINPRTRTEYSIPYPSRIPRAQLDKDLITRALDHSEVCVQALADAISNAYAEWKPGRMTGTSYKIRPDLDVDSKHTNPAAANDLFNNVSMSNKQYDNIGTGKEFACLNPEELVSLKGGWYRIGDLQHYSELALSGALDMQVTCQGKTSFGQAVAELTSEEKERNFIMVQRAAPIILSLYIDFHQRAARPLDAFREFDRARSGFVSKDNFARAFVIASMERLTDAYPLAFKYMTDLYTCTDEASRFNGMVDYAFFLRDLTLPPDSSIFLSPEELIELKRLKYGEQPVQKKPDYISVQTEFAEATSKAAYDASHRGVLEELANVWRKYRPRLRDYFLDFDRGRLGICEMSKLGSALTFMHADLNQAQVATLQKVYGTTRTGFTSGFRWTDFVTDLEAIVGR